MLSTIVHRGSVMGPTAPPRLRLYAFGAGLVLAAILAWPTRAAAAPPEFFGVSAISPQPADYEQMARNGVGTYRLLVPWATVQSSADGEYDWNVPDAEVAGAASNGMRPFPFVYGSPRFAAATSETPPLGSPAARRGWRRFVAAAVRRYGPNGEFWQLNPSVPYRPAMAWQVWNEQNAEHFWNRKPSPRRYAQLLRLSSSAISGVDPKAQVVMGGMFGFPNGRRSIYMKDYLKDLYRIGSIRRDFDGVALHPYGGTLKLLRYQVQAARKIMDRNGDKAVPIWITEVGWATDGPKRFPIVTSRKGQAENLRKAFKTLLEGRRDWGIRRVIWFAWKDFKEDLCEWCGSAGLLRLNGDPKPSLRAFRQFTGA
jgi:hypothetical protein